MRSTGNTYANDWYAQLADDGLGGLADELCCEELPMEPRQRAERRDWLSQREVMRAVPELAVHGAR